MDKTPLEKGRPSPGQPGDLWSETATGNQQTSCRLDLWRARQDTDDWAGGLESGDWEKAR